MRIIIEEVVSRFAATSGASVLSEKAIGAVVQAVLECIEAQNRSLADREEELSLENYQQRVRPGR